MCIGYIMSVCITSCVIVFIIMLGKFITIRYALLHICVTGDTKSVWFNKGLKIRRLLNKFIFLLQKVNGGFWNSKLSHSLCIIKQNCVRCSQSLNFNLLQIILSIYMLDCTSSFQRITVRLGLSYVFLNYSKSFVEEK